MSAILWFLAALAIGNTSGATNPPPAQPTKVVTSFYNRLSFHAIEANGPTCDQAKSYALSDFYKWSDAVPVRGRLVTSAAISPLSCYCGLTNTDRKVTCLSSYVEELYVSIDSNKTLSGFPHGKALSDFPSFVSHGKGLDCGEATEAARASLYRTLETQSANYEFSNTGTLLCSCQPALDPIATCHVEVEAFYKDAGAK